jgi:hypothetical protein
LKYKKECEEHSKCRKSRSGRFFLERLFFVLWYNKKSSGIIRLLSWFYFMNFLIIHEAITVAKILEKVVAIKAVMDMKVTLSRL